tara:strand:+ start:20061 stop:21167 length:1107 start_codon:yes stop_codon:yes gene_type:complete
MKKIPFFDYPKLWSEDKLESLEIIDRTASLGGFIMQKDLEEFERELAKYLNSEFTIGVGNATDAMEIFLQALDLKKGDEIIISSHTMLATASAIIYSGAKPVPVDIGYDGLIDPKCIEEAVNQNTVGIMPTQLNGRTCEMDTINKIAEKNGLFVVEDSAQALGSKYKGKYAGTFGIASCISFFPAKVMGCFGDAGAIIVNDKSLYEKMFSIRDHGRNLKGDVICWGRNSRLDNIQAALLRNKLKKYDQVIKRRREIAKIYNEQLMDIKNLILPPGPSSDGKNFDVYQNYELVAEDRDSLRDFLSENGIGTLVQWGGMAIHHFKQLGFSQNLVNTDNFFKGCLMLPMNLFISDEDVEFISSKIRKFYNS